MAEAQAQAKAFPVSWDQFHRDARALTWRLSGAGPFEAIVCVTRGGLVPAAIVARELEIRLIEKFPTAALAVIAFALDDWPKLHPRAGRLDRFVVPRTLETATD